MGGAAPDSDPGHDADAVHDPDPDGGGLVGEAVDWIVDEFAANTSFDPTEGPAHPQRRWWGHPVREYRW